MKVLTIGSFDFTHFGHLKLFNKCTELGEVHIVLNTDRFYKKYRNRKPLFTYKERKQTLHELGFKNVYPNNQTDGTVKDLIEKIKPDYLVIGSDWLERDYLKQIGLSVTYLKKKNISLIFVPYTEGVSSTEIKKWLNTK